MDNIISPEAERRAIAYLHAKFMKHGVFQKELLERVMSDDAKFQSLLNKYERHTRSSMNEETLRLMARILIDAYEARNESNLVDNGSLKIIKRPNHHIWLQPMTFKNVNNLPNGDSLDYTKEPQRRFLNVDLVPRLLRLFQDTPCPYLSISRGNIIIELNQSIVPIFRLPANVAVIFPKSLFFNMSYKHMESLHKYFMEPWIVQEYCMNPIWATGSDKLYDNFRNRVYVPPSEMCFDAYIAFNYTDTKHKTGIYAMYDESKGGDKSLPSSTPLALSNNDNGMDLVPEWFPEHARGKEPKRMRLSDIVNTILAKGGGIYIPMFRRNNNNMPIEDDFTIRKAKRLQKQPFEGRRKHPDKVLSRNVGAMYGTIVNSPVIRKLGPVPEYIRVGKGYVRDLLTLYHMGPMMSNNIGTIHRHTDLEMYPGDGDPGKCLYFKRDGRNYVMRLKGQPFPDPPGPSRSRVVTVQNGQNTSRSRPPRLFRTDSAQEALNLMNVTASRDNSRRNNSVVQTNIQRDGTQAVPNVRGTNFGTQAGPNVQGFGTQTVPNVQGFGTQTVPNVQGFGTQAVPNVQGFGTQTEPGAESTKFGTQTVPNVQTQAVPNQGRVESTTQANQVRKNNTPQNKGNYGTQALTAALAATVGAAGLTAGGMSAWYAARRHYENKKK